MALQLTTGVMKYRENPGDAWKPIVLAAMPSNNLLIDIPSFSSLPQTIQNAYVTANHVVAQFELGTPGVQTSDWTVTTTNGSVTITGSISGSTTLKLLLVTASDVS